MFETTILECRLVDLPTIKQFPSSSEDEWENYRSYGLRSADAYLLVYDVTTPSSFRLLQYIREQIAMDRGLSQVPLVVAANKVDLVNGEMIKEGEKETSRKSQDISAKVKKSWKLTHIECSAKHNWNVNIVFRELAREILAARDGRNGIHRNKEHDQCCLVCV